MEIGKYREELKIHNHYTNYKGRLFIKTLCDLFNDVANGIIGSGCGYPE